MRSLDRFLLHPAWGEGGEAATETGADEDDGPGSFWMDEDIKTGGEIEGRPPIASTIRMNQGHVAAVASPDSVPSPVGGHFNS